MGQHAYSLKEVIAEAWSQKTAIGHFNISDLAALRAIFEAARDLAPGKKTPVVIGLSEGERAFVGAAEAAALVRFLRQNYDYPIFINADHTRSMDKVKVAVAAGFDSIIFDAGKEPLDENIAHTKEAVEYIRSQNPEILVEGEMGYIGSSSTVFDEVPEGAAITEADITKAEDAARFVSETGVDLLAPAVGNIHGMFKNAPNPHLFLDRIAEIREAAGIPLVLHGGSGIPDEDFLGAMDRGCSIIHINTEIRRAWVEGIQNKLQENPDEVVPYKVLEGAFNGVKKIVHNRLKLFSKI